MAGGTQGMAVQTDVLRHGTPRAEGVPGDEGNTQMDAHSEGAAGQGQRMTPTEKELLVTHFRDQLPEAMKPLLVGESLSEILGNFKTLQTAYSEVKQEITRVAPPPVSVGTGNRQAAAQMNPIHAAAFGQAGGVARFSPFQKIAAGLDARRNEQ